MISGELKLESEVTEHPVEEGSDITDHIRPKPVEFTLEAVVSDNPLDEIAQHPSRKAVRLPIVDPFATQTVFGPAPPPNLVDPFTPQIVDPFASDTAFGTDQQPLPSAEAHARLTTIWRNRLPVTIEIPIASKTGKPGKRTFQNMALTLLTEMYGSDSDGGMRFSATFKQIEIRANRRVSVRTATPRGQGQGGAKASPTLPMTVRRTVLWNIRVVRSTVIGDAGAPLAPNHPFAYVDIGDAKGGRHAISYRWSSNGEGKPTSAGLPALPIPAAYAYATGVELNALAQAAFVQDLEVDKKAGEEQQKQDLDNTSAATGDAIRDADVKERNERNAAARGPQNTPRGVDMSRFDLDENQGPTFTSRPTGVGNQQGVAPGNFGHNLPVNPTDF